MPSPESRNWLIWDGDCAFCSNAVDWFARHDRDSLFMTTPAQECPSPPMTPKLEQEATRSVIVVTRDGRVILGGTATMYALESIGWHPRLARLLQKRPFVWIVNAGYRIVANNRQFFSRFLFTGDSRR